VFLNPLRQRRGYETPKLSHPDAGDFASQHHSLQGSRVYAKKSGSLSAVEERFRTSAKGE
jgi:hypothetical protein